MVCKITKSEYEECEEGRDFIARVPRVDTRLECIKFSIVLSKLCTAMTTPVLHMVKLDLEKYVRIY